MTTIYKYPLAYQTEDTLMIPFVKIMGVYPDGENKPCLYALVDTSLEPKAYNLSLYGTGWVLSGKTEGKDYLGTFRISDVLVLHAFGKEGDAA